MAQLSFRCWDERGRRRRLGWARCGGGDGARVWGRRGGCAMTRGKGDSPCPIPLVSGSAVTRAEPRSCSRSPVPAPSASPSSTRTCAAARRCARWGSTRSSTRRVLRRGPERSALGHPRSTGGGQGRRSLRLDEGWVERRAGRAGDCRRYRGNVVGAAAGVDAAGGAGEFGRYRGNVLGGDRGASSMEALPRKRQGGGGRNRWGLGRVERRGRRAEKALATSGPGR